FVRRHGVVETKDNRLISDGARKADAVRRLGANEDRVTRRTDDMPAGRVVLREHARERQHDGVLALTLHIAAGIRHGSGRERTDCDRVALEQRPPDDRCLDGVSHDVCIIRRATMDSVARWCPWRESNPHSLRNAILSRARLPVPPHGHWTMYSLVINLRKAEMPPGSPAGATTRVRESTARDRGAMRGRARQPVARRGHMLMRTAEPEQTAPVAGAALTVAAVGAA